MSTPIDSIRCSRQRENNREYGDDLTAAYTRRDVIARDMALIENKKGVFVDTRLFRVGDVILLHIDVSTTIAMDVNKKELLQVSREDLSRVERNQILDLSDNGERWEGDILYGKPFGWGVLYDSDNCRVYEGFQLNHMNSGFGTSYYSDIQQIEYRGEWCMGKRWGRGIQYDRKGNALYCGDWLNDCHLEKSMVLNDRNMLFHNHIEELVVSNQCCNGGEWETIDFSCMPHLKHLMIGNDCWCSVTTMKLIGMHELETVAVGRDSVRGFFDDSGDRAIFKGSFFLQDCDKVREFVVSTYSFKNYTLCCLKDNPSLEVIQIGEPNSDSNNFSFSSMEIMNLPKLKTLFMGYGVCSRCTRIVLDNLPELISIRCGLYSFRFTYTTSDTELIMRNLPKLTSFTVEDGLADMFNCVHHIVLENIPSLTTIITPSFFPPNAIIQTNNISQALTAFTHPTVSQ